MPLDAPVMRAVPFAAELLMVFSFARVFTIVETQARSARPFALCLVFGRNLVVGKSIGECAESDLHEVDCFAKKLDLAVLRDHSTEKELVDGASRLARLRGELVLSKNLFRRVDHDLDIFKVHAGIEFANEAEETLDGFTAFVPPRNSEALQIGHLEGAILDEHLRRLPRIPERCSGELLQQL